MSLSTDTSYQLTGATRLAFLGYFASHIPITFLMAGQTALPSFLYPQFAKDLLSMYTTQFNDPLLQNPETWFTSFIWCETCIQVPYFMTAVSVLKSEVPQPEWFRTLSLIYGTHAVTAIIPVISTLLFNDVTTSAEKAVLFGCYIPYLLFPAYLVYHMLVGTPKDRSKND